MSFAVSNNVAGLGSWRGLQAADRQLSTSLERLSSGRRINRAADGASELAMSSTLSTQIGGLGVALRNTQDGISVLRTAEGGLAETHAILHRMRDLAVQAANAGGLDDRGRSAVQSELGQLASELDRVAGRTVFDGRALLDGSYRTTFQVGADVGETIAVDLGPAVSSAALGLSGLDVRVEGGYASGPAGSMPEAGRVAVSTPASTATAAVLTFARPSGTADFRGPAADVSAWEGLSGVIGFGGRSFDLSSVTYDVAADTDGNGTADSADLLAQLNAAASGALGLTVPPFAAHSAGGFLQFAVSEAVPGLTGGAGTALGGSAADLARATPTFTPAGAAAAITAIDAAIGSVSTVRAELGALQNRFEHNVAKLGAALDNTAAAASRIVDTDMAAETASLGRAQILTQAGTAMLAQANAAPQRVLSLLR